MVYLFRIWQNFESSLAVFWHLIDFVSAVSDQVLKKIWPSGHSAGATKTA